MATWRQFVHPGIGGEEEDGQSPQSCQSPYPLHTIFGCRPQSESLPRRARRGSGGAREFILFFLDLQRLPMEPWPGSKAAEPGWLPMPARSPEKRLWRAWQVWQYTSLELATTNAPDTHGSSAALRGNAAGAELSLQWLFLLLLQRTIGVALLSLYSLAMA